MPDQTGLTEDMHPKETQQMTHALFKSLPRELCDDIYDLLYEDTEIEIEDVEPYPTPVMMLRAPVKALRLFNHQFKQEYEERFLQKEDQGKFVVNQWRAGQMDVWLPTAIKCPTPATNYTTTLKINLWAGRSAMADLFQKTRSYDAVAHPTNLTEHRDWIIEFATHLPHLRSIRVTCGIYCRRCVPEVMSSLGLITSIPLVVEVEVKGANRVNISNEDNKSSAFALWTKEQGLLQDDEALKQCREKKWLVG